jgi:hypothetical protein
MLHHLQQDLCFTLLNHSFSKDLNQLDKDFLPRNDKLLSGPTTSRPLLLEIRVLRGHTLLRTHHRLIGGATPMERWVIMLTDAPTHALALVSHLQPHQLLLVVPALFLLPSSRTTLEEGLITLLWRKLQMLSLVCFPSMPLSCCVV